MLRGPSSWPWPLRPWTLLGLLVTGASSQHARWLTGVRTKVRTDRNRIPFCGPASDMFVTNLPILRGTGYTPHLLCLLFIFICYRPHLGFFFFFVWCCSIVGVRLALNLSTPCLSLLSVKIDYSWLSEYTLPDRLMGEFREKILENHGMGNILPVIFKTIKHQVISKKMYASFCLWFSHTKPRWVWLKKAPQVHPISLPPLFLTAATGDAAWRSPSTMQEPHLHCSWDPEWVHRRGL